MQMHLRRKTKYFTNFYQKLFWLDTGKNTGKI